MGISSNGFERGLVNCALQLQDYMVLSTYKYGLSDQMMHAITDPFTALIWEIRDLWWIEKERKGMK